MFTTTERALGGWSAPSGGGLSWPTALSLHPVVVDQPAVPLVVPCAARPSTGFVHRDGRCRCFVGGPPPELSEAARPDRLRWVS